MTNYKDLYKNQKEENLKLKKLIHTFFNYYKEVSDETEAGIDKLLKKKAKGGKMISSIFAAIAGFLAGTIFGHLVIDIIIEWIKVKGGII